MEKRLIDGDRLLESLQKLKQEYIEYAMGLSQESSMSEDVKDRTFYKALSAEVENLSYGVGQAIDITKDMMEG